MKLRVFAYVIYLNTSIIATRHLFVKCLIVDKGSVDEIVVEVRVFHRRNVYYFLILVV